METIWQWITQNDFFKQRDRTTVMSLHITLDNDRHIFIGGYTHSFSFCLISALMFFLHEYFETDENVSYRID